MNMIGNSRHVLSHQNGRRFGGHKSTNTSHGTNMQEDMCKLMHINIDVTKKHMQIGYTSGVSMSSFDLEKPW